MPLIIEPTELTKESLEAFNRAEFQSLMKSMSDKFKFKINTLSISVNKVTLDYSSDYDLSTEYVRDILVFGVESYLLGIISQLRRLTELQNENNQRTNNKDYI